MATSTARLGFAIETAALGAGSAALATLANNADRAGISADRAALRMNVLGQAAQQPTQQQRMLATAVEGVNQKLLEFIQRLDLSTQAAQRAARSWENANRAISAGLTQNWADYQRAVIAVSEAQERLAASRQMVMSGSVGGSGGGMEGLASAAGRGAGQFNLLTAAVQGLAGGLAFFAAGALTGAISGLVQIPLAAARAEDSLAKLHARLRFAFRGSDATARMAGGSIMGIADDLGMNYEALAQQCGDMAIAGRAMGMSSGQVGGAVESFGRLGMLSGANQSQINGAMWQVQQMMNLGTLRFQDYRYMATNMGALDDVLATGAGVSVSQLMTMISNGEVSAQRFFEYLERGMAQLEQQAMTAPETMERSSARMSNAWTRLMQDMGQAIEASSMVQSMQNLITAAIDAARIDLGFGTATERGNALAERINPETGLTRSQEASLNQLYPRGVPGVDREREAAMAAMRAQNADEISTAFNEESYRTIREISQANDDTRRNTAQAQVESAQGTLSGLRTLEAQRGQIQAEINRLQTAIDQGLPELVRQYERNPRRGLDPAAAEQQRQLYEGGLSVLNAQLAAIMDPFTRALQQQGASERALGRFGSRGSDLYMRAYEMDMAQAGTLERPGIDAALQLVLRQEVAGARGQQASTMAELDAQRQFILPSIGQGARERAQAEIDAEIAALTATYGEYANKPEVQEMLRIRREVLEGQSALQADMRLAQAQEQARREGLRLERMAQTAGDPVARRRALEGLEAEFAEADNPGMGDTTRGLQARRAENQIAERRAAGERRRREALEESDIAMGLNRERRIGLEILRLQREALADGNAITREQAEIEARKNIETQERVEREMGWINSLERSGRRLGEGLENIFFSSIRQGFLRGRISAEDALRGIANIALDIGEDIARNITAPWRKAITEAGTSFLDRFLQNFGINTGGGSGNMATIAAGGGGGKVPSKGSALGNAFYDGNVIPFAMGGVTASMGYFPMANGGIGSLAEAGAEAILPLARGPDGRLGVQNTGDGGGVQIVINDQRGADAEPVETQERRGPDGRRMIEMTLRDSQRKNVAAGKTDSAMVSRYGARPLVRQA
jgi:tape measure domain-containing protein